MAESILVHFKRVDGKSLRAALDLVGDYAPHYRRWECPAADAWIALAYLCDNGLDDCDDDDVDAVTNELGDLPSHSVTIELCRSRQSSACDLAASVSVRLLRQFGGVVDDTAGGVWTLQEIEASSRKPHGGFLDCYRHGSE
jgi:hypothetical protein